MISTSSLISGLADYNARLSQFNTDRSKIILQGALTTRLQQQVAAINAKYDGSAANAIEQKIDELYARKDTLAETRSKLASATDPGKLNDIKSKMLELRQDAMLGSSEAFDEAIDGLYWLVGSSVLDNNNLLGNPGRGTWAKTTTLLDEGPYSIAFQSDFVGSDYSIKLDNGATMTPDFSKKALNGNGLSLNFSKLKVVSQSGDQITFTTTDGSLSAPLTGTIRNGGAGLGNAWLYNNFATQADKDKAVSAINAAIKHLDSVAQTYQGKIDLIDGAIGGLDVSMDDLSRQYTSISDEEAEKKSAEKNALMARMSATEKMFSLTSSVSSAFITGLFFSDPWPTKQSTFDILMGK